MTRNMRGGRLNLDGAATSCLFVISPGRALPSLAGYLGDPSGDQSEAWRKGKSTYQVWRNLSPGLKLLLNRLQARCEYSFHKSVSRIHSKIRSMSFDECARAAMPLYASSKQCWSPRSSFR